ncbi:MAG TPA: hypothetical protein VH417_01595 [Vicinamibacterales bacterium]|jgi:hypothetical protein
MFIGHFAVGLAAKRVTPRISLAVLFLAAQFADVLWPVLLALGFEQVRIAPGNTAFTPLDFVSYPYSHSLALLAVWAVVVGGGYRAIAGGRGTAVTLGLLVLSHWLLDYLTHRPDMPLYPGGPKVGLGLWNSVAATLVIEIAMFAYGVFLYVRATRARDAVGRWGFVAMIAVLLLIYLANLAGGAPPSVTAIWTAGIAGAIVLIAWAWWVDHHREVVRQNAR